MPNHNDEFSGGEFRRPKILIYPPGHISIILLLFVFPFILILLTLMLEVFVFTLSLLGLSPIVITFLLMLTLIGSFINIVVGEMETYVPVFDIDFKSFMGIPIPIPRVVYSPRKTLIAVNIGGALVPTGISLYLLARYYRVIPIAIISILLMSLICYFLAKPIPGAGIAMPVFVPPLVACMLSLMLIHPLRPIPVLVNTYVTGTLGTLIGADLLHLNDIRRIGAKVVSIGGAGVFDGIFLSGILAIVLAILLII